MRDRDTIRKNLEAGENLSHALRVLTDSQLLEASVCLKGRSPQKAKDFFEEAFQRDALSSEMLLLSKMLCKERKIPVAKMRDRILVSCIRNPLSLAAAHKMCASASNLMISEESDFRSVCEAVSAKETSYAILPMCSSNDGYYPTFSKLVKTYDLKICASCTLTRDDSDEEVQLALLSRNIEIPEKPSHIVFSFVCDEEELLPDLIGALKAGGCIPKSIISSPFEYSMDIFEHRIEVKLCETSAEAILFFLEAALPRHTVLGIY